jgi:hypothetical protein
MPESPATSYEPATTASRAKYLRVGGATSSASASKLMIALVPNTSKNPKKEEVDSKSQRGQCPLERGAMSQSKHERQEDARGDVDTQCPRRPPPSSY